MRITLRENKAKVSGLRQPLSFLEIKVPCKEGNKSPKRVKHINVSEEIKLPATSSTPHLLRHCHFQGTIYIVVAIRDQQQKIAQAHMTSASLPASQKCKGSPASL
jgi:hypothetical protein